MFSLNFLIVLKLARHAKDANNHTEIKREIEARLFSTAL